ncbi:MAG: nucleotide sugar dehydrogenase, partial [Eubacteriaceae bacterium]
LVQAKIQEAIEKRGAAYDFDVVSNPEFLREGAAINDFMHPDRIVIGTNSETARDIMKSVYRVLFLNNHPFVFTDVESAELIKYASNAFLATKITFINEMANLCEVIGGNIKDVARAMGLDKRIGKFFLHPGPGYGGSCFPKDTKALVNIAEGYNIDLKITNSAIKANEIQKLKMVDKIQKRMEYLNNRKIAILGISFKAETDDIREAPAITII